MTGLNEAAQGSPDWQTSLLRLTAFCPQPVELNAVNWWEALTGKGSEAKNIRAGAGLLFEHGNIGAQEDVLFLQVQLARIDWILSPKDDPGSGAFPSLGAFGAAFRGFVDLMSKWLPTAPPLNRLAVGGQLLHPTADQTSAMTVIASRLPYVKIKWEGIEDFLFQLNRPKPSAVVPEFGPINRVVKLQSYIRRRVIAALRIDVQAAVTTAEQFSALLELDISTATRQDAKLVLPAEKLSDTLEEMVREASNIVSKGYEP